MKIAANGFLLRPYATSDVEDALVHFNNNEVHKMLRTPVPFTALDAQKRFSEGKARISFAIDINGFAGEVGFHTIVKNHKAEIYYSLSPKHWGQAVMTSAVSLACDWAAQEYQLIRIQAHVFSYNTASARVLEKCGFLCDGRMRKDFIKNGHAIDRLIYSKLFK